MTKTKTIKKQTTKEVEPKKNKAEEKPTEQAKDRSIIQCEGYKIIKRKGNPEDEINRLDPDKILAVVIVDHITRNDLVDETLIILRD